MTEVKAATEKHSYKTVNVKVTARTSTLEAITNKFGGVNRFFEMVLKSAEEEKIDVVDIESEDG